MVHQNFQQKNIKIRDQFVAAKQKDPRRFDRRLDLSWSLWMFGVEPFDMGIKRLADNGIQYVELKGDHFTKESGLDPDVVRDILERNGVKVSGTCGMYTSDNDLSSNNAYVRQRAMDYVRSEVEFLSVLGGRYLIVVPSAVGRAEPIDASEFQRSSDTLRKCGEDFLRAGIAAAIEPIRSAEVSLIHTVAEAHDYIDRIAHPGIAHINADIYHMYVEQDHIGEAILSCGDQLVNLHLADSNRGALGSGMIDLDVVIMAAYLVGMNEPGRFVTPEPLGALRNPYLRSTQLCDAEEMDELVRESVVYFREREEAVRTTGLMTT